MDQAKIIEWVEIDAPREDVFKLVLDLKRRLQLSPLWGTAIIDQVSPDFPQKGSRYHVRVVKGEPIEYDTVVTDYVPERKFAYQLELGQKTVVTWTLQNSASGTRVVYEEMFPLDDGQNEDLPERVREVVKTWLSNMKRYAELRDSRSQRLIKWAADRFYLKMRLDQRKTVQMILYMHLIGMISFVMAAIVMGIAYFLN